jgi:formylglycine-generating enzyme required for sulfatase activity
VLIKSGTAFMGADDLKVAAPSHQVTLSSFCLDKMEVTTEAYLSCSDGQKCPRPLDHVDSPGIEDEQEADYSLFCNARNAKERKSHPINCVSWFMAVAYCEAQGLRLPSEAEWEFAARGSDQRRFPWGDAPPSAKHLNACGAECLPWAVAHGSGNMRMYDGSDGFLGTAPVGSFPAGASAAGVLDMAGNVWEWTADFYGQYSDAKKVDPKGPEGLDVNSAARVMRGGGFLGQDPSWAKPAYRYGMVPKAFNHAIGFRCAGDPR